MPPPKCHHGHVSISTMHWAIVLNPMDMLASQQCCIHKGFVMVSEHYQITITVHVSFHFTNWGGAKATYPSKEVTGRYLLLPFLCPLCRVIRVCKVYRAAVTMHLENLFVHPYHTVLVEQSTCKHTYTICLCIALQELQTHTKCQPMPIPVPTNANQSLWSCICIRKTAKHTRLASKAFDWLLHLLSLSHNGSFVQPCAPRTTWAWVSLPS